jgi:RimJ/RimL family protein N-acetyltransferase
LGVTPSVVLREVRASDIEIFYEQQADAEAAEMAAFESRDRDALFTRWHEIMADASIYKRAIVVDETTVGHLVSWRDAGHREIGYLVGRQFWGRGIATEALRQFLSIVTERPLEGWVAPRNAGSIRVLEKNGFVFDREEEGYRVFRLY